MELWQVAFVANVCVTVAYAAIAWRVLLSVHRSRQWLTNPLAVTTGAIFLTCAAGHLGHAEHLVLHDDVEAVRATWHWQFVLVDVVTAGIGARYWMLRHRFGELVRGASLFEDVAVRRQEAFDIQDGIVQQLATAKLAFELGDQAAGMKALEAGLGASRGLVQDRSARAPGEAVAAAPGDLRREVASP